MTDEEILKRYNELVEYYGDKLPNFEQEPIRFAHCIKLFKYWSTNENSAM